MLLGRRWASRDVDVEDKAASAAIFLEDAAPVGLLSTLLVASVRNPPSTAFWGGGGGGKNGQKLADDIYERSLIV